MVGQVTSVEGVVEVIDGRGQHHRLAAGDWLREGDRLVTSLGGVVQVETTAGNHVTVSEPQTLTLRAELVADASVGASDAAVHPRLLQYVLAAMHAEHPAQDLSVLLGGLQDEAGFSAFAADQTDDASDDEVALALNIDDLIVDATQDDSHVMAGAHAQALDLMSHSGLPSEVALQQSLLKDYMKDA